MPHADVESERAYLTFANKCLAEMRARTEGYINQEDLAAGEFDSAAVRWHLTQRLRSLEDDRAVLCFGRVDEEGGDVFYVGRREVDDPNGEPVIVDWRAGVAVAFYRATAADPFGLRLRRRFTFTDRELADIFEEDFTDPDSVLAAAAGGVPDPLLAELRRVRTGQMRDIVATIQAEQDIVIRAPIGECLVVQGGPGTGKTAVGLHRAAFLLYEHRERLGRQGVLVVGPNRVFLEYISQVLPSLGETSVSQSTVDDLLGLRFRIRSTDPATAARIKGDARMAAVIARACEESIRVPERDVAMHFRARELRITPEAIAAAVASARQRVPSFAAARLRFRDLIVRHAYDLFARGDLLALSAEDFAEFVARDREARATVDGLWRPVNPTALIRRLLTSPAALARAADGVLDAAEQQAVLRPSARKGEPDPWTAADLPLLDEAEAIVKGETRRFGHVVVDEAQDLSAMALRMVARRAVEASLTVLGDLAQATGGEASRSWSDALEHLGSPQTVRTAELTIGYRLPAAILDYANRLLPEAAPHVTPAVSAREEGDPPEVHSVTAETLEPTVVDLAGVLSREFTTTAVIAPAAMLGDLRAELATAGLEVPLPEQSTISHRLSLLPASLAKGLEFDAVVVVEPAAIVAESEHGTRLLFVALTRPVQQLVIVHSRPLPSALRREDQVVNEAPELRTERLLLRRWRTEDREPFAALNADPHVMEFFPSVLSRAESDALADRIEAGFEEHGYGLWAVEVPGSASFIGFVGLALQGPEFSFGPAVEVGWRLSRHHWGMGYATEGGRTALRCGAEVFGIHEFVSMTAKTNLRSQRVMRRLGMTRRERDDFDHPRLPVGHPLRPHVLYRTAATLARMGDAQRAMVTTSGSDPVVVTAVGEFDFESSERLRSALMTVAQDFEGDVIVDLSRTEFLDSIAIGVLLQTWQRLRSAERELVIRSPHERIQRVLQIASIDEVVRVDRGA